MATLLIAACGGASFDEGDGDDEGQDSGPQPTGVVDVIELSANLEALVADGQSAALLQMRLVDTAGVGIAGETLTISSNAGRVEPETVTTAGDGSATASFIASDTPGRASVTVRHLPSGRAAQLNIDQQAGPAESLSMIVAPGSVVTGAVTSIVVTVRDVSGNPVSGEPVQFSVPTNASGGQLANVSATTDANGRAQVDYTAGANAGTDTLRATTAAGSALAQNVNLVVDPTAAVLQSLTLTALTDQVAADGASTARLRAVLTDADGEGIPGATIAFSTTAGSLAGDSAQTGSDGRVDILLTAPSLPGNATITASSGGLNATAQVAFIAAEPEGLTLTLIPSAVSPNQSSLVRATVRDSGGAPVVGERVFFSVTDNQSGGALQDSFVDTDANGVAETLYTAGAAGFGDITDRLRASTSGGLEATAVLDILLRVGQLVLSSVNDTLVANGNSTTTLRATVTDAGGSPVQGAPVRFSASAGSIATSDPVPTAADGVAEAIYTAPTRAGNATVVAAIDGASATLPIALAAGPVDSVQLQALPDTIPPGGSTTLVASAVDAFGNPIPDLVLTLSPGDTPRGSLDRVQLTTDDDGRATTTFQATDSAGSQLIRVRVGGDATAPDDTVTIVINAEAQVVGNMTLDAGADSVRAGEEPVQLRATVTDLDGDPVAGRTVRFGISSGTFDLASPVGAPTDPADRERTAVTNAAGVASLSFRAPTFVTTVDAVANVDGFRDEVSIAVEPGAPDADASSITANPSRVVADGTSEIEITVVLVDGFGNPLVDGRPVRLITGAGQFVGGSQQTLQDGRAVFTLRAPNQPQSDVAIRVQDVPELETTVDFEAATTGDPAGVRFLVEPAMISVAGVGQADQSRITVTVVDSAGNPIDEDAYNDDTLDNLRARFVVRPNGGETLSGRDAAGDVVSSDMGFVDVRTRDGVAVLNLVSGTVSGVVEISLSVLAFDGTDFDDAADVAARASLPQVSIASGPPATLVFTGPNTNAIEDLENGNYRLTGKVDVIDRFGNSVPDGTVVNFSLIDTAIAHGASASIVVDDSTLDTNGNSLITLRCSERPVSGGEATMCAPAASDLTSPVFPNGAERFLRSGDSVFIANAQSADRRRVLAAAPQAQQAEVQTPYRNSGTGLEFWAGTALRGFQISGLAADGSLTSGSGVVADGLSEFRVTYPSDEANILTGCYGYNADRSYSDRDRRSQVPQARQVILAAEAGEEAIAVNVGDFCAKAIAGGTLTFASGDTILVAPSAMVVNSFTLRDGGDQVPLPYVGFACFVSDRSVADGSDFNVTVTPVPVNGLSTTDVSGVGTFEITRTDDGTDPELSPDDRVTITCTAGDASNSFEVGPG